MVSCLLTTSPAEEEHQQEFMLRQQIILAEAKLKELRGRESDGN